ncbi:hypothetical protein [Chitinophaga caseinilytica]|uniref:hypothetical protein n=1 Tax=Chitinophaga caseinilytica TaxID=2267521 RepID=UPI003C2D04EB
MNGIEMEKFHSLSITGRYIYGYLCLMHVIEHGNVMPLPESLGIVLKEFVESEKLDKWQDEAESYLPSNILEERIDIKPFKSILKERREELALYYLSQKEPFTKVLEALIWLGISNLYVGFDTSITFTYIETIVRLLLDYGIALPDFEKVETCHVTQKGGWGEITKLSLFV